MGLFHKKTETKPSQRFDPIRYEAVIRCSICTGEQEAGFIDRENGTFISVALLRGEADLRAFCDAYGVKEPRKIY